VNPGLAAPLPAQRFPGGGGGGGQAHGHLEGRFRDICVASERGRRLQLLMAERLSGSRSLRRPPSAVGRASPHHRPRGFTLPIWSAQRPTQPWPMARKPRRRQPQQQLESRVKAPATSRHHRPAQPPAAQSPGHLLLAPGGADAADGRQVRAAMGGNNNTGAETIPSVGCTGGPCRDLACVSRAKAAGCCAANSRPLQPGSSPTARQSRGRPTASTTLWREWQRASKWNPTGQLSPPGLEPNTAPSPERCSGAA